MNQFLTRNEIYLADASLFFHFYRGRAPYETTIPHGGQNSPTGRLVEGLSLKKQRPDCLFVLHIAGQRYLVVAGWVVPRNRGWGREGPIFLGNRKCRSLQNFYVLLVNSVHLKEFLVQIHRVDSNHVELSEFSTFLDCKLIRDVL